MAAKPTEAIEQPAMPGDPRRMTSARAAAYRRVVQTLRDLGPAMLWPAEESRIREAADTLLFCHDVAADAGAREAFAVVTITSTTGRAALDGRGAHRLLDDIWGCGAFGAPELPVAAGL